MGSLGTKIALYKIKKAYIEDKTHYIGHFYRNVGDDLQSMGFTVFRNLDDTTCVQWSKISPFPNIMTKGEKYEVKKAKALAKTIPKSNAINVPTGEILAEFYSSISIQHVLNTIKEASIHGDAYCIIFQKLTDSQIRLLTTKGFHISRSSNNFWTYRIDW